MSRIIFITLFFTPQLFAQTVFAPLNADYYWLTDRYEIRSGNLPKGIFSSVKPYGRVDIQALADTALRKQTLSNADRFNLTYLQNDNWEYHTDTTTGNAKKPFLKNLYEKKKCLLPVPQQRI